MCERERRKEKEMERERESEIKKERATMVTWIQRSGNDVADCGLEAVEKVRRRCVCVCVCMINLE